MTILIIFCHLESQPSWAAWIEIIALLGKADVAYCRSPLGLRGLKYTDIPASYLSWQSQPSWAAWIEIKCRLPVKAILQSQPSWAAWIEIVSDSSSTSTRSVAALLGCVD